MIGQSLSRRGYLGVVGTATACGLGGCLGSSAGPVALLSAGSLARTFEDHVGPAFENATGISVHGEYYGSTAIMRMVEDRTQHPDVIVSADATLLRERLYDAVTDWDIEFATNSLGIGYDEGTAFGRALDGGTPWYEAVGRIDDGELAIGDPDLDPLGYRAVQAFELAEREHDLDGFRDRMVERVYMEPEEPQMLAGVETGNRAGAIVYHNMALDHDMSFFEFPDVYNFADPKLADHYAAVTYTTDEGYTAPGRPILYNATVNGDADNPSAGRQLVRFLADSPGLLRDAGLTLPGRLPRPHGRVPGAIEV